MKNTIIQALEQEIDRLAAAHPHVAPLLQAVGPLLLEKERWLEERPPAAPVAIDEGRSRDGVALLQQGSLLRADDPWQSAGQAVARAIGRGFPFFAEEMARWAEEIADGAYCCPLQDGGPAAEPDTPPARRLFREFLLKFLLTRTARAMAAELAPRPWNRGYCPVCGGLPHLALLRDKGQRYLQCGHCSHEWPFGRLTCPACGHEDPEDSQLLFIEGHQGDSVFTCSNCKRYLITSDRSSGLGMINADLISLCLVHLDFIAQGKGLLPMAECPWNILPAATGDQAK